MKGKNISIALLTIMIYEAIAQLPLLDKSGGMDILSEGLMEIFVYVHFFVLLIIFIVSLLRKKSEKGILIQLLFVLSILLGMFIWNRIQWFQLPEKKRNELIEQENKMNKSIYGVQCENGKLCFQNYEGVVIIPCLFDDGKPFVDDTITCVSIDKKWGFIDRTGKTLIAFQFDKADNFYEGVAAVKKGTLWGFIDLKGNWVIKPKYNEIISPFENGKAMGKIGIDSVIILK